MNENVNKKKAECKPKERIVRAAVKLFAHQGFDGTGLRTLASTADVNLAMINYFFGSKKALLKKILDTFFSGYLAIAREELAGDDDLQTKLGRFISSSVIYFETHRDYLLVTITELPHDDPEIIEHKAAWGRQMMEIIDREICRPLSTETGSRVSPTVIGPLLTSMMASRFLFAPIIERVHPSGAEAIKGEDYADIISKFFLKGIAAFEAGARGLPE